MKITNWFKAGKSTKTGTECRFAHAYRDHSGEERAESFGVVLTQDKDEGPDLKLRLVMSRDEATELAAQLSTMLKGT